MIYLYRNQANEVVLTLDEKASTSTYDVLFEFTNEITKEVYYFTATDTSLYERYNLFTITETASQNVYYGSIRLEAGQYRYVIYEMPTASPKSLDPDNSVGELEVGRVTVFESETTDEFTDLTDSETPSFE